jgi:hypothetical protein
MKAEGIVPRIVVKYSALMSACGKGDKWQGAFE